MNDKDFDQMIRSLLFDLEEPKNAHARDLTRSGVISTLLSLDRELANIPDGMLIMMLEPDVAELAKCIAHWAEEIKAKGHYQIFAVLNILALSIISREVGILYQLNMGYMKAMADELDVKADDLEALTKQAKAFYGPDFGREEEE